MEAIAWARTRNLALLGTFAPEPQTAGFKQIELFFSVNKIRSDICKYDLVISILDPEVIQEIADVLLLLPLLDEAFVLRRN